MKKAEKVYLRELNEDIEKEKKLLWKELSVIVFIVALCIFREVYLA